ncbi:MAG: TlyA family RNA methyltransferase [Hyphomicrobiaceae bacterium]|nr:TlyA family RNA methyltransferase [Hyphomicrobiaceae bacterium]
MRLDQALVARGMASTRARARDLILRGEVMVGGHVAAKPAVMVAPDDAVALTSGPADYVSRGALKLRHALLHFKLACDGIVGLDVGASTGGFTETLLAAGARRVYAVDNGRGQLHPRLAADARVISLEATDARTLTAALVPEPLGAVVADVSFISLAKVLPASLALAAPGAWLVALVKPQFEAAPGLVPRHGVVRDATVHAAAVEGVRAWLGSLPQWRVIGWETSPILGGDGNTEFLIGARHVG